MFTDSQNLFLTFSFLISFFLGIDIGAENCVIAVARKGGIDIIANEASYRTTPALVTFGEEQRYIGQSAHAQFKRNVANTVSNIKRLIGRKFSEEDVQKELPFLAYKIVPVENDEIGIELRVDGEKKIFSPVQICATLLGQLKRTAEDSLQQEVRDVVLSVPGWWNDKQRRALLDAAQVAGLNCLQLINELTACALELGIRKDKTLDKDSELLCFFDMGDSQTQCAVMKYSKGKLEVLGYAYDQHLGGRNFTAAIVEHFRQEWLAKYKIDIATNPKAMLRTTEACQKLKHTLSANSSGNINLDCLMNDKDVSGKFERETLVKAVQPVLDKVLEPVKRALEAAGVKKEDIVSVEVVGDSHRIPAVGDQLNAFFGKPPSKRTNATEVVAKGSAWQCARRSPSFKVVPYELKDLQSYPITLNWKWKVPSEEKDFQSSLVFNNHSVIPLFKQVTFKKNITEDTAFCAAFAYEDGGNPLPPGTQKEIGQWDIVNIPLDTPTIVPGEKPLVRVGCKLDESGIVFVSRAEKEWNEEQEYEEEQEVPLTEEELAATVEKKEDGGEEEKKDDTAKPDAKEPKTKKVKVMKKKNVARSQKLEIRAKCSSLPQDIVQKYAKAEVDMRNKDKAVIELLAEKNKVESYMYEARENLSGKWFPFVLEDVKEQFLSVLNNTELWIEEDEGNRTKQDYTEKLNVMKGFGDPLNLLAREAEEREPAIRKLQDEVKHWTEFAETKDVNFDHLTAEDRQSIRDKAQAATEWLKDVMDQQASLKATDQPAFLSADVYSRATNLEKECSAIKRKPKPKPKPVEEKKPEEDKKKPEEGEKKQEEAPEKKEEEKEEKKEQAEESK